MDPGALFAKHQAALLRYLTRLCSDADAAADAAQDAYLRLLESPPTDTGNVRAWLFTVATNAVRDGWKRDKSRQKHASPGRMPLGDPQLDPHSAVEHRERAAAVRHMLDKLSEREKTMVLMWLEGFKHSEIGETLGTTTKTVSPTIARALNKISGDIERYMRENEA